MTEAEEHFKAANGMGPDEAWQFILRWKQEGKLEQVRRGCEEILRSFPDHAEAQSMLDSLDDPGGTQASLPLESAGAKSGIFAKIRATIKEQRQKLKEMSPPSKPKQGVSAAPSALPQATESERLLAAACYSWIFVIIPMLLRRDSEFVQFHAWQGIVITAGVIIVSVVIAVLTSPFRIVAESGGSLFLFIDFLIRVFAIIIYLWGGYNAYKGKWLKLPLVYNIAEKLHKATKA